ncbi:MAG: hypothetical protein ACE5GX_10180 [Thermoanaerobaculia bacterium]
MRRLLPGRVATILTTAIVASVTGCSFIPSQGDRHFASRDFVAARDAYRETLERRDGGRRVENALYHLALIYLQPDPALSDPEAARAALTRLTYIRPRSEYAAKAEMLLALHTEAAQLSRIVADQQARARDAENELSSLQRQATERQAKSQDTERKVGQLGSRIGRLQSQIDKLREELTATEDELASREEELARLKKIDLGDPP